MNTEQTDLARRLAAHPSFAWKPGMSYGDVTADTVWRVLVVGPDAVCAYGVDTGHVGLNSFARLAAECLLDLCDDATSGALLAQVWAAVPMAYVERETADYCRAGSPERVSVSGPIDGTVRTLGVGATLGEACARALIAIWGTP